MGPNLDPIFILDLCCAGQGDDRIAGSFLHNCYSNALEVEEVEYADMGQRGQQEFLCSFQNITHSFRGTSCAYACGCIWTSVDWSNAVIVPKMAIAPCARSL